MRISKTIALGLMAVSLSLLAGCSTLFPPTQAQIQAAKLKAAQLQMTQCNQAPFLLANLTQSIATRVYYLKPGVMCYGQ